MLFKKNNFSQLSKIFESDTPCVTILIPTHRMGNVQEDKIRFKNALSEASTKLQELDYLPWEKMTERQAKGFLTPAYDLLDNNDFWLHLSDGLAVFIGENRFEYYVVPINFDPMVYVHHHYYLWPLMSLLNQGNRFFLLSLSQGKVCFFEGHQYSITPVKINDLVPDNFKAAMAWEDPEKSLQMHGAQRQGIFHGHGVHKDEKDWQLEQFCRMVDDGLMEMLHDENAPMIVAGVDELVAVYKHVSNYNHIVEPHVSGNTDDDDPVLLHEKAWSKMKPYLQESIKAKKEEFDAANAGNKASSELKDIVPAAINGRVDTLFLTENIPVKWGTYREKDNSVKIHSEREAQSIGLINLAAIKTFEQGGSVQVIEQGQKSSFNAQANAIFRY